MGTPTGPAYELRLERLIADLAAARMELLAAVDALPPALESTRLANDWSLGQMIAHLGYWAGWATEAIHLAEQGRLGEHDDVDVDEDERNAVVKRIAAQTDLPTIREREAASAEALAERLRGMDPSLLDALWSDGRSTLEQRVAESAGGHYRKHLADITRAATAGR
jgi:hypothetical protein